jgi:phosphate transport system substrate-binding protein
MKTAQLKGPDFARLMVVLVAIAGMPAPQRRLSGASPSDTTVLRVWGQGVPSTGGDTFLKVLTRLEASYAEINPSVHFSNELRGNDSALGGLYVGAADLAFMTRRPSYIELDGYQQMIQGQTPFEIPVMRGGPTAQGSTSPLVLVVNRANPLDSLTLAELKSIFTASHDTGLPTATLWQDLGVKGLLGSRTIRLYGFDTESEEAATFSIAALGSHPQWACNYMAAPDTPNAAGRIVQEIQHDLDGLGLTTLDAVTSNVKVLEIAASGGTVGPTPAALGSGDYVLGRTVLALARKTSDGNAEPAVRRFLAFLLSTQGQAILRSDGTFVSLDDSATKAAREALK